MESCFTRTVARVLKPNTFWVRHHAINKAFLTYKMISDIQPIFSASSDNSLLRPRLQSLLARGWKLDDGNTGICKTSVFKTYTKCMVSVFASVKAVPDAQQDLFSVVAVETKSKNHHPSVTIVCPRHDVYLNVTDQFNRNTAQ